MFTCDDNNKYYKSINVRITSPYGGPIDDLLNENSITLGCHTKQVGCFWMLHANVQLNQIGSFSLWT